MQFEYDQAKSEANQYKHGIDFEEAQLLWQDLHRVEIEAKSLTESRFMVIGKLRDKHWSVIITYRHKVIRIISVHRSRQSEVAIYES